MDPITIAGITHYKADKDTPNWKGYPDCRRGMYCFLRCYGRRCFYMERKQRE